MTVVGFDVGKDMLYGARLNRSGAVKEHYEIANTPDAVATLLGVLASNHKRLLVASEATAEYHRPLALACLRLGIPFRLLNPITTKQFTRATVRKRKTDKTDAEIVARVALQGEGTVVTPVTFDPAKPTIRTSMKLAQLNRMLHLMQLRLNAIMPNEQRLLAELAGCHERINEAVQVFRAQAAKQADQQLLELLMTIPGVGVVTALTLMAEVGDIRRFRSPKALVAYAGLDPRVRQSGLSLKRNTRLTKRGSPYLRHSMYLAATVAERHDIYFQAVFAQKRREGKRYKEATIVVARKLLNCAYAVWKSNTAYQRPGVDGRL
ncbi:MAG TPA: transposase [Candidatus Saccharimonadales bacterium]|nr:transposase [Candidatus Saccharimonadales bacterium]